MKKDEILRSISRLNDYQGDDENTGNSYFSYAMGTLINLRVNTPPSQAKEVIQEVLALIDRLEKIMSYYDIASQVSQINQQAGKAWVSVDPELFVVIKESQRYARLTNGLFNITVAALITLWQHSGNCGQIPSHSFIEDVLTKVDYEDILIDEQNRKIKLRQKGQKIDLGGIAKGYAANQVIQYYRQKGLHSAIINLGGNVALLGKREDGKLWQVGIQDPDRERGQCLATIAVSDTSVVTSGDYERFFLEDDRRYHHILNPFTGYPVDSRLRSVTVIHPDAMLADVLATTLFISGLEKGIKMLRCFADIEVIIVHEDKKIYLSKGLLNQFQLTEKGYSLFQF
jgi:FAD:protein FMN transferase